MKEPTEGLMFELTPDQVKKTTKVDEEVAQGE